MKELTLDKIIDSIISEMEKEFKDREVSIKLDSPFEKEIESPAIRIDFEDLDEGPDKGDERFPARFLITAYCILSNQTDEVERQILYFASELFILVRQNYWGLGCCAEKPEDIKSSIAHFKVDKEGYATRSVSWEQTFYLGKGCWDNEGTIPVFVWSGIDPDIGLGHEKDYELVSDNLMRDF